MKIIVENVRKKFPESVAVDGLSFEILPGEIFGLLGPNGAGKTTTISMILGVLRPDSGSITIDGLAPDRPEARAMVGLAPQSLALYEDLTAEENLQFFGRLYEMGWARLRERVDWALAFAGLSDRRKHAVKTYSGGMKRRLNLACGLIHEPKVVFLDEPTVGVDPQSRNHIFESVEKLREEGLSVLYTTHYMEEAERLCDRVGIMEGGKLLALDTVQALKAQHGGAAKVLVEWNSDAVPSGWQSEGGGKIARESDSPYSEIAKLAASGATITRLQVEEPNLENVFLNLTGRSLRDS